MSFTKFSLQQFINIPGLKALGLLFTQPSIVIPNYHLATLNQLNLVELKTKCGVECLVFDKDNTLSYCYVDHPHHSVIPTMTSAMKIFPDSVAILSNSAGSSDDEDYRMAKATELAFNLPVIKHTAKKPGCLAEVIDHFETRTKKKILPQQICVIGDRLMTDVVFANQYGMVSVLVEPLTYIRDHPVAVIIRFLETKILLPFVKFLLRFSSKKS